MSLKSLGLWAFFSWALLSINAVEAAESTEFSTECHKSYVKFEAVTVEDAGDGPVRLDGKAFDANYLDTYQGGAVKLFSCKINQRYVRFNILYKFDGYNYTTEGRVSLWIDGIKMISNQPWGDVFSNEKTVIMSVIFNNKNHLTICKTNLPDGHYRSEDEKPACYIKDISEIRPNKSSIYYGDIKLTNSQIILVDNNMPFCRKYTDIIINKETDAQAFNSSFEFIETPKTQNTSDYEDATYVYMGDVDNDGIEDALTYEYSNGIRGQDEYLYSWKSGKTGGTYAINDLWPTAYGSISGIPNHPLSFPHIGNRTYVYEHEADDKDMAASLLKDLKSNHNLMELHNDGRITPVCSWRPAFHPEEFM